MTPQLEIIDFENLTEQAFPSRTYRLGEKRITGFVDGIEAVKQAVAHILSTERYAYPIYDSNYGVELNQFIGASFEYIEAGIGNAITEALLQDDRITDVEINDIKQTKSNAVQVDFAVITKLGTFTDTLNV